MSDATERRKLAAIACFALPGKNHDLKEIGQRLRVGVALAGSTTNAGM
jgi:TolB-like protein